MEAKMFSDLQIETRRGQLAAYAWDASGAKAAVCHIHGLGEHARRYMWLAEFFRRKGISTLAIDLRGHGRSPGRRGHVGARADTLNEIDSLVALARERHGGLPMLVYGHSLGGNIVLHYRRAGRLSAVPAAYIATAPWLELRSKIPKPLLLFAKGASKLKPDLRVRAMPGARRAPGRRAADEPEGDKLLHGYISFRTAVDAHEAARALLEGRIEDRFGGAARPAFILQGTEDNICVPGAARALAAAEGGLCSCIEFDGYCHELYSGSADESGFRAIDMLARLVLAHARQP
jgi:alpha-beta hydrolase superfamily lysophospholipase